jgi:hypothetical protein
MRREAVTERLREVARQLARRGLVAKGVDMSRSAVTARLKTLAALSDMCLRLVAIGRPLLPGAGR